MREFCKGVVILVLLAGLLAGIYAWAMVDQPDQTTWSIRFGAPAAAITALAIFLGLSVPRRDLAHDYLFQRYGGFLERRGFCFMFETCSINRTCFVEMYFQNKHEGPCTARVVLRPARNWLGLFKIKPLKFDVACGPAAFGKIRLAMPVPRSAQGKRRRFEIGASVSYPRGRGRKLRFRNGAVVRNTASFGFGWHLGSTVWYVLIDLPAGVAEDTAQDVEPEATTLWQLGEERM